MAIESFGRENKIDKVEVHDAAPLEMAAGEIKDFLFNPVDGNPFGANRFTVEELKERFSVQPQEDIIVSLSSGDFLPALKFLCEQGILGFDAATDTYYEKASA
jgi:hypothetical protein